jgi:hypothetical protein
MSDNLTSEKVSQLLTVVEEATRSSEEGVKYFVEPAHGTLRRSVALGHHFVFGRRGSGKSSLLRKAAADLTVARSPIAWVDLEPFKGHSYPDLVCQYAGARKRRDLEIVEFWKPDAEDKLRRVSLIFDDGKNG